MKRKLRLTAIAILAPFAVAVVLAILANFPRSSVTGITTDMTRADVEAFFGKKPFYTCSTDEWGYRMDCCFALGDDGYRPYAWITFNSSGKVTAAFYCERHYYQMEATDKMLRGIGWPWW
jgi:hypothetical protein